MASQNGHLDIASLLCERGAALDLHLTDGATALYAASQDGHLDIARLLCERGCNTLFPIDSSPYAIAVEIHGIDSLIAHFLKNYPH